MGSLTTAVFALLIAVPVLLNIRDVPDRLRDVRAGIWGVVAPPAVLAVMVPLGFLAYMLTSLPVLGWGWFGHNIAMDPLVGSGGSGGAVGSASSSSAGPVALAVLAGVLLVIVVAMLLFNYAEEELFRHSWPATGLWALLHVLMGIELAYVIPILGAGVVYKGIHDRWGLETAYVAHLSTNMTILGLLLAAAFLA